jgi:hypothetical protein
MLFLIDLLARPLGKVGVVAAAVVALLGLRTWDVHHQRAIGSKEAVAKIDKANDNASKLGKRAADKSMAGGVLGGRRDPSTRD